MFELAPRLLAVLEAGDPVVVATAVDVQGSAPSGTGTSMAVLPGGEVVGTISGGCVEGSLYGTAEEVLATGVPVLERFGFEDPSDPPGRLGAGSAVRGAGSRCSCTASCRPTPSWSTRSVPPLPERRPRSACPWTVPRSAPW
ncbi:XdhC family protein [Curtobacterium sp. MCPF17_052]|uniref:XdhC family protein n=1 Tax=Curtobacterium sp. MCPF17_052 TaxID=2175655 RepID=UPI0024DF915F|nr:XdhC family protein [Curtobacterium sp. MCPF17_052]WIB13264.1 XdhC family protein [Curtobacterium sp. MCPF17_052]